MQPIYTQTVGAGGVASITFNNIPQTFTDLCIKHSARSSYASVAIYIGIEFNGVTTGYSGRDLYGTGSAVASRALVTTFGPVISGASATSNTFGNGDFYIPNYTGSSFKSFISDSVSENNATLSFTALDAFLWSNTAAITSVKLTPELGNLVQYSTFTLYGITKG